MSARKPRRRAVWVGFSGQQRVEVVILRECKAYTLCKVVRGHDGVGVPGSIEQFHPDDLRPL